MSVQSTLIELHGVTKKYGNVEALREVSLAVQRRQIEIGRASCRERVF